MRKPALGAVLITTAAALALAGCSSSSGGKSGSSSSASGGAAPSSPASSSSSSSAGGSVDGKGTKVGIILPDTQSSQRWVTSDPDALSAQCKADNLQCDIQNANGSAATMKTIAESMENNGVKVLMITNLDSASGAQIEQEAKGKGVTTVDYDRLTLGGTAALYVSFDNVKVGETQGSTLVKCSQVQGQSAVQYVDLNGSPTDNNATLFKQGYDSVLSKQAGWTKVDDQSVPGWDAPTGLTIFTSMLQAHPGIKAVMVANDGLANSVITVLKNQQLNGKVAVTGQDATAQGLQHIMDGDQCMTVYKPSKLEAIPAINAIATLVTGGLPQTNGQTKDTQTGNNIPSILATPIAITKDNVAQPINDNYTPKSQVCTGTYAAKCTAAGVK